MKQIWHNKNSYYNQYIYAKYMQITHPLHPLKDNMMQNIHKFA